MHLIVIMPLKNLPEPTTLGPEENANETLDILP